MIYITFHLGGCIFFIQETNLFFPCLHSLVKPRRTCGRIRKQIISENPRRSRKSLTWVPREPSGTPQEIESWKSNHESSKVASTMTLLERESKVITCTRILTNFAVLISMRRLWRHGVGEHVLFRLLNYYFPT